MPAEVEAAEMPEQVNDGCPAKRAPKRQQDGTCQSEADRPIGTAIPNERTSKHKVRKTGGCKLCAWGGCPKRASFAEPGAARVRVCKTHMEPGMIDVVSKRCEHVGCLKHPAFAEPGETRARVCKTHIESGMVNVVSKHCEHTGCLKQPAFANPGETRRFCKTHMEPGMIDVKSRRCEHAGCLKQPAFADHGETRARLCKSHMESGMIDVKSKCCERAGCLKHPTFANPGETRARVCKTHKEPGMIDVVSKRCEHVGCLKHPAFAEPGETRARVCKTHMEPGMIDVVSKRCEHVGCTKQPVFAEPGEARARVCKTHMEPGMVNVVSKCCEHKGCPHRPTFANPGETRAQLCTVHKLDGMIDVKHLSCVLDGCPTRATNPNYRGYCFRCFVHTFTEEPVSRNYKVKEVAVTDAIKVAFPDRTLTFDRKIEGGCSLRRPDVMCDLGSHVLIVEVDEEQHEGYDPSCDNKRTMQLMQDGGSRHIVFLRFNPDTFTDSFGVKHPTCFSYNRAHGAPHVPVGKRKQWEARLSKLLERMRHWMSIEGVPDKEVTVERLFFDGC